MKINEKNVIKELNVIYQKNNKLLRPCDVVNFAKNPKSALHKHFEWDNTKAAAAHRLHQARQLITVHVTVIKNTSKKINMVSVKIIKKLKKPIQKYQSLSGDRKQKGGGYREIVDILSNEEFTKQLLEQAYKDLIAFQTRYRVLKEFNELFEMMDSILANKTIRRKNVG